MLCKGRYYRKSRKFSNALSSLNFYSHLATKRKLNFVTNFKLSDLLLPPEKFDFWHLQCFRLLTIVRNLNSKPKLNCSNEPNGRPVLDASASPKTLLRLKDIVCIARSHSVQVQSVSPSNVATILCLLDPFPSLCRGPDQK